MAANANKTCGEEKECFVGASMTHDLVREQLIVRQKGEISSKPVSSWDVSNTRQNNQLYKTGKSHALENSEHYIQC